MLARPAPSGRTWPGLRIGVAARACFEARTLAIGPKSTRLVSDGVDYPGRIQDLRAASAHCVTDGRTHASRRTLRRPTRLKAALLEAGVELSDATGRGLMRKVTKLRPRQAGGPEMSPPSTAARPQQGSARHVGGGEKRPPRGGGSGAARDDVPGGAGGGDSRRSEGRGRRRAPSRGFSTPGPPEDICAKVKGRGRDGQGNASTSTTPPCATGSRPRGCSSRPPRSARSPGCSTRSGVDYIEGGWPGANPTDSEFFDSRARDPRHHDRLRHDQAGRALGGE